jgi:hypothetical protein
MDNLRVENSLVGTENKKLRPVGNVVKGIPRCGAKTKLTGRPCKRRDIEANGRCKLHGGLSTGPKTAEGKARSARNGFRKSLSSS